MVKKNQAVAAQADDAATLGLRERGKLEKRRRIKAAARQAFTERGYDAATTRDIAGLAEIGIGTLFTYAKDKRELLLMIINDDLDALAGTAVRSVDPSAPLVDQLAAFFESRYRYWAGQPALGRPAVRETLDFLGGVAPQGPEAIRFYARRPRMLALLTDIVRSWRQRGLVAADVPVELAASLFITIYLTEVRRWLMEPAPDADEGLRRFRELAALAIRGVAPGCGSTVAPDIGSDRLSGA